MDVRIVASLCFILLASVAAPTAMAQQPPPPPCDDEPGFHRLDFWVGTWDVYDAEERLVGTNRIEKILDGCAVMEHWAGVGGGGGKSLFYYLPAEDQWKQVWVTQWATRRGGVKEKTLIEALDGGGVRFQGIIPLPDGRHYLDRTTLTPLDEGRVRQVIEWSADEGATWTVSFDAVYVPRS